MNAPAQIEDALSRFSFIVVLDPTDQRAYSISSRYVLKTKGLTAVLIGLLKNENRKRNAHKKHVEGKLCSSIARGVKCDRDEECPNIHIMYQGLKRRRLWCPSEKFSRTTDVESVAPLIGAHTSNRHPSTAEFQSIRPQTFPDYQFQRQILLPSDADAWIRSPSRIPQFMPHHPTYQYSSFGHIHPQFFPRDRFPPQNNQSSPFVTSQDNVQDYGNISSVFVHSTSPPHTQSPGHSPESSASQVSSPPISQPSSTHRQSPQPLQPPPALAPVNSAVPVATPTTPYRHSPYTATPTQICEDTVVS